MSRLTAAASLYCCTATAASFSASRWRRLSRPAAASSRTLLYQIATSNASRAARPSPRTSSCFRARPRKAAPLEWSQATSAAAPASPFILARSERRRARACRATRSAPSRRRAPYRLLESLLRLQGVELAQARRPRCLHARRRLGEHPLLLLLFGARRRRLGGEGGGRRRRLGGGAFGGTTILGSRPPATCPAACSPTVRLPSSGARAASCGAFAAESFGGGASSPAASPRALASPPGCEWRRAPPRAS